MNLSNRRFVFWVLGGGLLMAVLAAAINFFIDPYMVFGRSRVPGFNDRKPAVATHEPLLKAYLAARTLPTTVVLGSSRSGIGIRPDSAAWPAQAQPVQNMSVVGTTLGQQLQYLLLASTRANQPAQPQQVLVGLDFESFLFVPAQPAVHKAESAASPDEQQARLIALTQGGAAAQWQQLKDAAIATLTLDALIASAQTVANSARGSGNDLSSAGRTAEWQLATWTRADGPYKLFEQKLALSGKQLGRVQQTLGPAAHSPPIDGKTLDAKAPALMKDVSDLLAWAQPRGVQVTILLQPSHAVYLLLLDRLGYWAAYEQWKQAVVAEVARAQSQGAKVVLWDFGGFEPEFSEPLTPQNKTALQGFWDPVHYTSPLGDRILATLFATTPVDTQNPAIPRLAAEPLTAATLANRLAQVRAGKQAFRAAQPQLAIDLARWVPIREAPPQSALPTPSTRPP